MSASTAQKGQRVAKQRLVDRVDAADAAGEEVTCDLLLFAGRNPGLAEHLAHPGGRKFQGDGQGEGGLRRDGAAGGQAVKRVAAEIGLCAVGDGRQFAPGDLLQQRRAQRPGRMRRRFGAGSVAPAAAGKASRSLRSASSSSKRSPKNVTR